MPVPYQDKPIERLREEVIDQLIMNYGHGEISLEAFQRRLDEAYETQDHAVLNAVTADLSLQVDREYAERKNRELGVHYSSEQPDDIDWMVNIMGGSSRAGAWSIPRQLRIVTVMGGAELDFSEALFAQQDLHIKVFCLMGGVEIKVPEQVSVHSKAVAIMGGVENNCRQDVDRDSPRIVIEGVVLMGGISIEVKRPERETWWNFADKVRQTFGFATGDKPGN